MHEAISHRVNHEQPLALVVRAPYVKSSLRPLKWLSEVSTAPLVVTVEEDDQLSPSDFHVLRRCMPISMVYYDMHLPPEDLLAKHENIAEVNPSLEK